MIEVLAAIAKLGVGGGIGFLVGIALVWWIEPTTTGGIFLLIVIPVVICGIVSALLGRKNKSLDKNERSDTKSEG
jgi:hypothetical protein